MKYYLIEVILFVSINMYSQEFIAQNTVFSDTLKYRISLPETQFNLQNTENQLKTELNPKFDFKYALKFQNEEKNTPLPHSTARQIFDFQSDK